MKKEKNFIPCPVDDGDEVFPNGVFEFNITKIEEFIQNNHDAVVLRDVDLSHLNFLSYKEALLDSVDIDKPVILAEISPGHYNLIDGNHRAEKARRMGRKTIPAYWLNVEQHVRFLTSKESYEAYIMYWNSKEKAL